MSSTPFPVLLDCRQMTDFCNGHLHQACNIPIETLPKNMHLLPDTHIPLRLCGNESDLSLAHDFLIAKGYQVVEQILWHHSMTEVIDCCSLRLWQPSPLVQKFVDDYATQIHTRGNRGLDIACGAGRDAVYLAMKGWNMLGIDYRQDALNRVHSLANHQGVSVNTRIHDLETGSNPFATWEQGSFDLISVARYLHRPLFPYIQALLAPQGIILYHTFMQGSEIFGSPKNPNYLLKTNELATFFQGWNIWYDDVFALSDGRQMSYFIAQKC